MDMTWGLAFGWTHGRAVMTFLDHGSCELMRWIAYVQHDVDPQGLICVALFGA